MLDLVTTFFTHLLLEAATSLSSMPATAGSRAAVSPVLPDLHVTRSQAYDQHRTAAYENELGINVDNEKTLRRGALPTNLISRDENSGDK